jgi:hypothetical protein
MEQLARNVPVFPARGLKFRHDRHCIVVKNAKWNRIPDWDAQMES